TPLHYAAKSGRAEAVRTLVKAGASIDALDSEGKTPLHHTVKDIVPYILVEMEIIKSTSPSIWSSSQKARVIGERKKLDDTARALVELGAKLNLADKITVTENIIGTSEDDVRTANTWIPLHYAAFHNRTAVIRILADAGAHLNPEDAKGNTPLHIASEQGNVDAIGVLFEVGADDRVKNKANHKANGVAMNDTIKTMVENPGVHWPLKAYAVGSVSSSSMDISMRITCEDARICRVFLDCFDKDGDRFQGWIGDLEKHRGKTTIGSIDQRATLSLSLSELKTLVDTTQVGGLDCALHSQQRIAAQVWSTTDSGSANITAYRLSEKHNVSEKAPVRFYYGDDSTPYIRFRCLADKGEECKNTEFQCADDEGADLATIKAGTVKRLHIYTVAGSHGTATGTGSNTASRTRANIGDNADYRILGTAKGWYSCKVSSSNPFMVYASDLIRTENVRFTANSTSISME
ncbi:MAG: ankyrin repeat domain-containing protein, partial [Ectothiorhodospiraceae bacterium AqS1]|nr:ankyrin repeat domain-containing protein [Ectothiorhodospiraceae bacterium AqS1]